MILSPAVIVSVIDNATQSIVIVIAVTDVALLNVSAISG